MPFLYIFFAIAAPTQRTSADAPLPNDAMQPWRKYLPRKKFYEYPVFMAKHGGVFGHAAGRGVTRNCHGLSLKSF